MARKIVKPKREFSRQQLSSWQKDKRRQRIIFGIGLFIIVAVLATVISAWFIYRYKPFHETVIRVNDTKFDTGYLIKTLEYFGEGQSVGALLSQVDEAVQIIERNEIMRQAAEELDFIISNREVDQELKSKDPSLSKDYRDIIRAEILAERLASEYFDQQVPSVVPQIHLLAMLLESENQAAEVRARIVEGGGGLTELATELSLEIYSQLKGGNLGWQSKGALEIRLGTPVPGDYAFSAEVGALSQPIADDEVVKGIGYWLIRLKDRVENPASVYINVILLGSEEDAVTVRQRLEAGEDFNALAKELSLAVGAEEDEGDIGWITPGAVTPTFDGYIFDPEVELDIVSEVIKDEDGITKGGFWLLEVADRDDSRQIEESDRELFRAKLLDEWVNLLFDDPENEIDHGYLTEEKKVWVVREAVKAWQ